MIAGGSLSFEILLPFFSFSDSCLGDYWNLCEVRHAQALQLLSKQKELAEVPSASREEEEEEEDPGFIPVSVYHCLVPSGSLVPVADRCCNLAEDLFHSLVLQSGEGQKGREGSPFYRRALLHQLLVCYPFPHHIRFNTGTVITSCMERVTPQ